MVVGVDGAQCAALQPEAAIDGETFERKALWCGETEGLGHGERTVDERVLVAEQRDAHALAGETLDRERALEGGRAPSRNQ